MCSPGNQTISKACFAELLKLTKKTNLSNQEARQLLRENGGCLVKEVQKKQIAPAV